MEFFRIEVKVRKEQDSEMHRSSVRAVGPPTEWRYRTTTLTAGKRQGITNGAGDLPLYHHSPHLTQLQTLISERKIQESLSIFWQCFWQCFDLVCFCQLRSAGYYIIWSGSLFCCSVFKDRPFIL